MSSITAMVFYVAAASTRIISAVLDYIGMTMSLAEAAALLTNGQVGVIPTDTLMGLACSVHNLDAVNRLYGLKSRDNKPGTLIGLDIEQFANLGIKKRYLTAVEHYWPGPISVIIPCSDPSLNYLHQGKQTLAVRIPSNEQIRTLLAKTGPLVTTSANLPGEPPAKNAAEASAYFGDTIDFYVDALPSMQQLPSTIIQIVDDAVTVLRQGAVHINQETGEVT